MVDLTKFDSQALRVSMVEAWGAVTGPERQARFEEAGRRIRSLKRRGVLAANLVYNRKMTEADYDEQRIEAQAAALKAVRNA